MGFTADQLDERKHSLGGSDAAVAIGISPYKTPLQLYLEKTGLYEQQDISENDPVYWGSKLEDIIAEEYIRRSGNACEFPKGKYTHPQHSYMTAHVDRLVENKKTILECKTANLFLEKDWGEAFSDDIPLHYLIQVQHYLAVLGYETADVAVLIGGQDFRIYQINRSEDLIKGLLIGEAAFWEGIQNELPPLPVNETDLKILFPGDNGNSVKCSDEILEAVNTLRTKKAEIKALEKEIEPIKFAIKHAFGDCTNLVHDSSRFPIATLKQQNNNRFQINVFRRTYPELVEKFMANKPFRTLRLKK